MAVADFGGFAQGNNSATFCSSLKGCGARNFLVGLATCSHSSAAWCSQAVLCKIKNTLQLL